MIQLILTILEAILYFAIGLVIYLRPNAKTLGEVFFVVGFIIVVNRIVSFYSSIDMFKAIREEFKEVSAPIKQLESVVDLNPTDSFDTVKKSYLSITNKELRGAKDAVMERARRELEQIKFLKKGPVLDEADFYRLLYSEFDNAKEGTRIHILSTDEEHEWTNTYQEQVFWQKNIDAAKRGANVVRVFLFDEDRLPEVRDNPAIYGHRKGSDYNVVGRVVDRKQFSGLIKQAGEGFILINDDKAIIDVFSEDGQARGYVTVNETTLHEFRQLFDRMNTIAKDLEFPEK